MFLLAIERFVDVGNILRQLIGLTRQRGPYHCSNLSFTDVLPLLKSAAAIAG